MFKKYRATKENAGLLSQAMDMLGYRIEVFTLEKNYEEFKYHNWHIMFHTVVNLKMQELEKAAQ
jgi:hypothetical protein